MRLQADSKKNLIIRPLGLFVLLLLISQGGCIWKLWTNDTPPEERIHDVYGTVQEITANTLVIERNGRQEEFAMVDSSIKGSDFGPGAYVHVYYKIREDRREVTMVVEKVN